MKFQVSSSKLFSNLQMVSRVIATKNTIEILENIIFSLEGNVLTLKAADTETMVQTRIDVENAEGSGTIAFNARRLLDSMLDLPEQPIVLEIEEESFKLTLKSQNGFYSLVGESAADFPPFDLEATTNSFTMPSTALLDAINKTIFCTSNDPIRPIMMGLFFDMKPEGMIVVATDAHRLSRFEDNTIKVAEAFNFIFPKKPALLVRQIFGKEQQTVLSRDEKRLKIEYGSIVIITRLIEGKFFDYDTVIPKNNSVKVIVDKTSFVNACKRVSTSSYNSSIKLAFNAGELCMSAQNTNFSTSAEENITCNHEGEDLAISFKATLLIEMINAIETQDILLTFSDPNHAGLILPTTEKENQKLIMLLMPLFNNE